MPAPQDREASLVEQALQKPAAERRAWLDATCGADKPLPQRVERILAAREHETDGPTSVAEATQSSLKLDLAEFAPDVVEGEMLGRYRLLEKLGEGGCGVVYVAEQTEPVRRVIAS